MNNLLESTMLLIKSTSMTRREIANGANVDVEWLNKFAQGNIKEPGVNKVQRVHDYLFSTQQSAA